MLDERQASDPRARELLSFLDNGGYDGPSGWVGLRDLQRASEAGTELYTPEVLFELRGELAAGTTTPPVEVVDATTQTAAHELSREGSVALLNFASARNPGGGFLTGARAQEEELCRCSGLYRTLVTEPAYYVANREQSSLLYTDHLIYSPEVPFLRTSSEGPLLSEPFVASVITAPAPNRGALLGRDSLAASEIRPTFEKRWRNVLAVARAKAHRLVVLGAWGCGAFRNDPVEAAQTASSALASASFADAFDRIVFAIPGEGEGKRSKANLEAFRRELGG